MEVRTITLGIYQTNTYLIVKNNQVIIIDPVSKADRIQNIIQDNEKVVGICLTHGHFDHIGAVDDLVQIYKCPVYIHELDFEMTQDPEKNYSQTKKIKLKSKQKFYQDSMSMSKSAIYKQLTSEYGEGFTDEEAQYAIDHLDD